MNCDTIEGNWLTAFKSKMNCSGFNTIQLKSGEIGIRIELLLCKYPTIFDIYTTAGCNIAQSDTLSYYYNRIKCGNLLTEVELAFCEAEIARLELYACQEIDSGFSIRKAGSHTWAGGADETDSIAVDGLEDGDFVFAQVYEQSGTEEVVLAVNDHANGQIDITLSDNGEDGVTKINYFVIKSN